MTQTFKEKSRLTPMAKNILKKRYFAPGESKWKHIVQRVVDAVAIGGRWNLHRAELYSMMYHRYFIPNSPTLVNAGKKNHAGLSACFVVPFEDTIEDIYETKKWFALIARKGGGCGTTLSHLRPQGDPVNGSTHGYAGGGVAFADTISHDMDAITQAGFRSMAIMFTMNVRHPDIIKFISAKETEGKIANANISVVVDDAFMRAVENNEDYWTEFNGKKYNKFKARDIFNSIVEGAWQNGEPGLLFYDRMNDSPYKYAGVKIEATNPCGEQPLPPFGSCNLGSLDLSKFVTNGEMDYELLEKAVRLSVNFLDSVIDVNEYPTPEIEKVSKACRQIGLGVMGVADMLMQFKMAYGSAESLDRLDEIFSFVSRIATDESEEMGRLYGVPEWCQKLPAPRRNITVISYAPTGTISLIANCNSGIEPFFSEMTERKDKTGTYEIAQPSDEPYFRCAVSSDGTREVTWEEHVAIQAVAQLHSDSGVSKTINFPTHTHRETIGKAFFMAWKLGCKGITVYRNASRKVEVLSPKNINKDKCPVCSSPTVKTDGCTKCTSCDWSLCSIG